MVHKTNLTSPLVIEVHVQIPESERSCICVLLGVSILPFSTTLSNVFWNYSDSVVFCVFLLYFGTVPTVLYFVFFYCILELFRQCGIFCFSIVFWNYSDSVVFCVFLLYFGTVPTVWYFLFFYCILELFDSVVFFVFLLYFGTVLTMWYVFVFSMYSFCHVSSLKRWLKHDKLENRSLTMHTVLLSLFSSKHNITFLKTKQNQWT